MISLRKIAAVGFYVKTFPFFICFSFFQRKLEKKNEMRHASERFEGNFSVLLSSEFEFYFIFSYAWFEFLWGNSTPHEVTIKWTHKADDDDSSNSDIQKGELWFKLENISWNQQHSVLWEIRNFYNVLHFWEKIREINGITQHCDDYFSFFIIQKFRENSVWKSWNFIMKMLSWFFLWKFRENTMWNLQNLILRNLEV